MTSRGIPLTPGSFVTPLTNAVSVAMAGSLPPKRDRLHAADVVASENNRGGSLQVSFDRQTN